MLSVGVWVGIVMLLLVAALGQRLVLLWFQWENFRSTRRKWHTVPVPKRWPSLGVIVPCCGVDPDLEQNLSSVLSQRLDRGEVIFVVQSLQDPAVPVIRRVQRRFAQVPSRLVVAGPAEQHCQKVHNLLAAIDSLSPTVEVLVFVDSDARLPSGWLDRLVGRLCTTNALAVSGYRVFVPQDRHWATYWACQLNAQVLALLGSNKLNPIWGGGWAIFRRHFEALGLRRCWDRAITDDLSITARLHHLGLRVCYEPGAAVATQVQFRLSSAWEFLVRQYTIGRCFLARWFHLILTSVAMQVLVFWLALGTVAALGPQAPQTPWLLGLLAALWSLGVGTTWFALTVNALYLRRLGQRYPGTWVQWIWSTLWPWNTLLHLAVLIHAKLKRHLLWRGIGYQLDRHGRVLRVSQPWPSTLPLPQAPPEPAASLHAPPSSRAA